MRNENKVMFVFKHRLKIQDLALFDLKVLTLG